MSRLNQAGSDVFNDFQPITGDGECSDLPPVTPVGLLLFVSGSNVNFDTFKSSKDSERERADVCVSARVVASRGRMRATFPNVCSVVRL